MPFFMFDFQIGVFDLEKPLKYKALLEYSSMRVVKCPLSIYVIPQNYLRNNNNAEEFNNHFLCA